MTTERVGYWGHREQSGDGTDPGLSVHAAAAEVVENGEWEKFAVGWLSQTTQPFVRVYDTAAPAFMSSPKRLGASGMTAPMISAMGHDPECSAVAGAGSCAWFTWYTTFYGGLGIYYQAIGDNNQLSSLFPLANGYDPSGRAGNVYLGGGQWETRKLVAWISDNRERVYAQFIGANGTPIGSPFGVRNVPSPYHAYQTAVGWGYEGQMWVVAWSEHTYPAITNGRIYTNWVDPDGSVGTPHHVMYCEGGLNQSEGCLSKGGSVASMATYSLTSTPPSSSPAQPTSPVPEDSLRYNHNCACKGFWIGDSEFGWDYDRYRIHQYQLHAILGLDGALSYPLFLNECDVYCPIASADFWHGGGYAPYQQLFGVDPPAQRTDHYHLLSDSAWTSYQGTAIDTPYWVPQAFASGAARAAAVATTGSAPFKLQLSIVDVHPGVPGCP